MSSALDDMYREVILDHYRAPRGKKPLEKTDITSTGHNPACGDELELDLAVEDGKVAGVHVDCKGCAISTASASMLAETVKGMPLDDAIRLAEAVRKMLKGEEVELPEDLGDLEALKGVRQFPVRIKCALLAWLTLIEGMKRYRDGQTDTAGTVVSTEQDEPTTT
ncbi:MAG: SUF system NifU family Fe-S cluster assembly protein [Candidatus Zixiibacteriota bacterium]|nr:MAG: SUF system NifU family Fe-S cluster assembly protein [candidate division Zixibacteria bacterium]